MLSSISWKEFITALLALVGIYYAIALLILYRKELIALISRRSGMKNEAAFASTSSDTHSMMGKTVEDNHPASSHMTHENAEAIVYAPSDELPDEVGSSDFEQQQLILSGQLSELIDGIKTTCSDIARHEVDRPQALTMFNQLLSRYPRLKESLYRESITDYIYSMTQPPFTAPLSMQDIQRAWDSVSESAS